MKLDKHYDVLATGLGTLRQFTVSETERRPLYYIYRDKYSCKKQITKKVSTLERGEQTNQIRYCMGIVTGKLFHNFLVFFDFSITAY